MEIRFLGHASFELTHNGVTVLLDPWLTGNPKAAASADELAADAIVVTHGHGDHIGDTVAIAQRTGADVVRWWRSPESSRATASRRCTT